MNRKTALKTMALGVGAIGVGAAHAKDKPAKKKELTIRNKDVYTDGKFDEEKAKDAIMKLCEYHGYPVFPELREGLWVSDYGTGKFTEFGLAAFLYINNVEDRYMQMDLFLTPNQMLPEHWHLEAEGNPAKLEAWVVRYGKSYIVGIGEDNLAAHPEVKVPKCHNDGKTMTKHVTPTTPGQCVKLAKVESRHWQFAGAEGAIVTEVANVHTNSGVRHTDKGANDHFLNS